MILAAGGFDAGAATAFVVYTIAVFVVAIFSHRLLKKRSFLQEYFLGSRGLGVWALAMTYAATSASGGSFTGFPSLIYEHGWILALWIASYMIVPICCMGLLGKRLNQVGRKSGAITIPDVFRDRFNAPRLGILASLVMAFFMAINLVAQFKAGAIIIERLFQEFEPFRNASKLLEWVPEVFPTYTSEPLHATYCLGLLIFAVAVIAYTAYGGFRAVVWTDVLQGIVMFLGILVLLVCTLVKVGGLDTISEEGSKRFFASATLEADRAMEIAAGELRIEVETDVGQRVFVNDIAVKFEHDGDTAKPVVVGLVLEGDKSPPGVLGDDVTANVLISSAEATRTALLKKFHFDSNQTLISGPGFDKENPDGFLPIGLAISFFFMWAISGAGQPTTMVRLMAFESTKVYRRAMFSVCIYYTLIYIPLIIIFVCARQFLPPLDRPDMAMATTVLLVVPGVLAGIIMAAPFAAVMSTVDSFLLAISSSLVRDVYQRSINPNASPARIRTLSYLTTMIVGLIVMFAAINPPRFLQTIIILTGAGLASSFLAPMYFTLYWKRMTATGCVAGIIGGCGACFGLYVTSWLSDVSSNFGGFLPVIWGLGTSIVACIVGSLLSAKPAEELVIKYFKRPSI
jgi:Na+/pantothenate symporter